MQDQTGETCDKCGNGEYREASVMDDISGILHCTNCRFQVNRWIPEKEPDALNNE